MSDSYSKFAAMEKAEQDYRRILKKLGVLMRKYEELAETVATVQADEVLEDIMKVLNNE